MTWNLQHGGGIRTNAICNRLKTASGAQSRNPADGLSTIVLTEFRSGKTGEQIRSTLDECGFHNQAVAPTTSEKQNTVIVASKYPFESHSFKELEKDQHRCIRAEFDHMVLYGLYFALGLKKIPLFELLCGLDQDLLKRRALLIGDFNTGQLSLDHEGAAFTAPEYFEKLLEQGWVDTWRSRNPNVREYSWYSRKGGKPLNGFRIDHALATPMLDREIKDVQYLHDVREGRARLSDHSAMVVEWPPGGGLGTAAELCP
jgi:exodeoxyribonuclease-3